MKELSDRIYQWLYEDVSLQGAGIVTGVLLIVLHLVALLKAPLVIEKLKFVPRSQNVGTVFLTVDLIWAYVVTSSMDLGEFYRLRWLALASIPAMYVALLFWVNEYLGARAIGIFMLLAVCPILDAAFLKPPDSRVLLSLICYTWLSLGLFWIGMPYLMRDQIGWATRNLRRFRILNAAGAAYGMLILTAALVWYSGH